MQKPFAVLLLVGAMSVAGGVLHSRAAATPAAGPADTVRTFYNWYVTALAKNRDPLTESATELKQYVTKAFLDKIDKARKSPDGLEADPFLAAQDFDKEWASKINVRSTKVDGRSATCDVILNGRQIGSWQLRVRLEQEDGKWKLADVQGRA